MAAQRAWFDQGAAALERATAGRHSGIYACPLCMRGFNDPDPLTAEHVPAAVIGGRKLVLTCRECNHRAGSELERHSLPAKSLQQFATGTMDQEIKATLVVAEGRLPVMLSAQGTAVHMTGAPNAADPAVVARVLASLGFDGSPPKTTEFRLECGTHHPRKAQLATLKAVYLAAFALLGYRYVARLGAVRQQLASPDADVIERFHVDLSEHDNPDLPWNLMVGEADGWGPCLVGRVGSSGVVLPPPLLGPDDAFWAAGASAAGGDRFAFRGSNLGWPRTRRYFLDD